jgi:hypothetical protein
MQNVRLAIAAEEAAEEKEDKAVPAGLCWTEAGIEFLRSQEGALADHGNPAAGEMLSEVALFQIRANGATPKTLVNNGLLASKAPLDVPGLYVITNNGQDVAVTKEISLTSGDVAKLDSGVKIDVLEFASYHDRLRARIKTPEGWISLENTANGHRFARKAAERDLVELARKQTLFRVDEGIKRSLSPYQADHGDLCSGARVELFGLQARPEMNGQQGTCGEWLADLERWSVVLDSLGSQGTTEEYAVRPKNLSVIEASRAPILPFTPYYVANFRGPDIVIDFAKRVWTAYPQVSPRGTVATSLAGEMVLSLVDYENNNGESLSKGDQGIIKGPGLHGKDKDRRVELEFPNMKSVSLLPNQFQADGIRVGSVVVSLVDYENKRGEKLCTGDRGIVKGFGVNGQDKSQRIEIEFPNMKSVSLLPGQCKAEVAHQIKMTLNTFDEFVAEMREYLRLRGLKKPKDESIEISIVSCNGDHAESEKLSTLKERFPDGLPADWFPATMTVAFRTIQEQILRPPSLRSLDTRGSQHSMRGSR